MRILGRWVILFVAVFVLADAVLPARALAAASNTVTVSVRVRPPAIPRSLAVLLPAEANVRLPSHCIRISAPTATTMPDFVSLKPHKPAGLRGFHG